MHRESWLLAKEAAASEGKKRKRVDSQDSGQMRKFKKGKWTVRDTGGTLPAPVATRQTTARRIKRPAKSIGGKRRFVRRGLGLRGRRRYVRSKYGRRRFYGRRRSGIKRLSKNFMMRFYNTQNPFIKERKTYNWRIVTSGGTANNVASYIWQLGQFVTDNTAAGWSPDDQQNRCQGVAKVRFHQDAGYFFTDLAWARHKFWTDNLQTGKIGCLLKNEMIFRFRNNMNIKCFITFTYFIPRKGVSLRDSYPNGLDMIGGLAAQSNFVVDASSDWRNAPNVNALFKMVVKKWILTPGESRGIKFKCGGLPFVGNNNRFDESTWTQRFTRFLNIKAYGDMVFGQTGVVSGKPVLDSTQVGTGPVNLSYTCIHKIEGKKVTVPNSYIIDNLSTAANLGTLATITYDGSGNQTAGPKTVPLGGDETKFIVPNTTGWVP